MTARGAVLAIASITVLSCSSGKPPAGNDGSVNDPADASQSVDTGVVVVDGAPGTVDGPAVSVDADPAAPDAAPGTPDAAPGTPDAAPGTPDAAPIPDAALPPDADTCPTMPCDLVEQCGCTANLACDINPSDPINGGTQCRAINNAGTEEDTCTFLQDCGAGYICVGDGTDNACKRYCTDNTDCDGPRGQCVIQLSSNGMDIPDAVVCSSNCDPVNTAGGGCPAGWGCGVFIVDPDGISNNGDEVNIADCTPAGTLGHGAICTSNADCLADHTCVNTGMQLECLRNCNNVGSLCSSPQGTTCFGFAPPADIGGTEYGVCF